MQTTFVILAIIDVLLWTWLASQLFAGLKKMTILNSEQRLISEQVKPVELHGGALNIQWKL